MEARRHAIAGLKWSIPFVLSNFVSGIAFGVIARRLAMEPAVASLFSALAFSGTAQLAALQLWGSSIPVGALVISAVAVNGRYLAMGATLHRPLLGYPAPARYCAMLLLTDAGWALGMRAGNAGREPLPVLLSSGLAMWLAWILGTWAGAVFGAAVPESYELALEMCAVCLLAAIVPEFTKTRADILAILVAVAVAAALQPFMQESWAVLLGGLTGAAAPMLRR